MIREEPGEPSLLWKIAVRTTERWWTACVIFISVVIVVILSPVALELKKTGDILQFVPRQSLAVETTLKVNSAFSSGFLNPYNLVIAPRPPPADGPDVAEALSAVPGEQAAVPGAPVAARAGGLLGRIR